LHPNLDALGYQLVGFQMVTPRTPLSELRRLMERPAPLAESTERLVRSVEQSMRVEGYPVSHTDAVSSAERVLNLVCRT